MNRANILVVDDLEDNLLLIKVILDKLDVNLILAKSGPEALAKIKDKELALVLLDVHMPIMSGVDLAKIIQNDKNREKLPIIFITAHTKDEIELEKYYQSGAIDFIQKPFRKNILLCKARVFLDLYWQKKQIERQKLNIQEKVTHLEELNQSLNKQLIYENLLSKVSEMAVSEIDLDDFISSVLVLIGRNLGLCRSYVYKYNCDTNTISLTHEWLNNNEYLLKGKVQKFNCSEFPMWVESLKRGESYTYSGVNEVTEEAVKKLLSSENVNSILVIPLFVENSFDGFIGFNYCLKLREWQPQEIKFLSSISRIIVSVTERKHAEEKLKQTRLLLKSSLESPKKIIIVCIDKNYNYLFFNEAHKTSMKAAYNKDVEPGMNILECITNEEDRFNAKANFDFAFSGKELVTIQEFGDTQRITFENSYSPVVNDKNEIFGVTLFTHDITQRKQAEDELKDSLEQLQQLSKHIEKVREEERVSIARELHDDLGQALTAVKIDLGFVKNKISNNEVRQRIVKTAALVSDTIKTVQKITFELRPKIIDDLGLEAGIDWYTSEFSERNGIDIFTDMEPDIEFSNKVAIVIFRIMQESLTNVSRHARATKINIRLKKKKDYCIFSIVDNGVGIPKDQLKSKTSFGIIGMKERAKAIGGTLKIKNCKEAGTSVRLKLPLNNKTHENSDM